MITPGSLLITTLVLVAVFGSQRLRHIGEDLGAAVRNFRKGLHAEDKPIAGQESIEISGKTTNSSHE